MIASTGPRTPYGICPAYQAFTAAHLGDGYHLNLTDIDGACWTPDRMALMEDKKRGAKCSTGQLITLQAIDALIYAGARAIGGYLQYTVYGQRYEVAIAYEGLIFLTDAGTNGANVKIDGPTAAVWVVEYGQCFSVDTVVRNRSGDFMIVLRNQRPNKLAADKAAICKAVHILVKAGMDATDGKVEVSAARYPLRLTYKGMHLFEHDDPEYIDQGRLWWDNKQCALSDIVRVFTFAPAPTPSPSDAPHRPTSTDATSIDFPRHPYRAP